MRLVLVLLLLVQISSAHMGPLHKRPRFHHFGSPGSYILPIFKRNPYFYQKFGYPQHFIFKRHNNRPLFQFGKHYIFKRNASKNSILKIGKKSVYSQAGHPLYQYECDSHSSKQCLNGGFCLDLGLLTHGYYNTESCECTFDYFGPHCEYSSNFLGQNSLYKK